MTNVNNENSLSSNERIQSVEDGNESTLVGGASTRNLLLSNAPLAQNIYKCNEKYIDSYKNIKNAKTTIDGVSFNPLGIAVQTDCLNVVKNLVEQKEFDITSSNYTVPPLLGDGTNKINAVPLHLAAIRGSLPVVKYVFEKGGDDINTDARDSLGRTPLHYAACYNQNPKVVKFLMDQGADPDAKDDRNQTPKDWMSSVSCNSFSSPDIKTNKLAYLKVDGYKDNNKNSILHNLKDCNFENIKDIKGIKGIKEKFNNEQLDALNLAARTDCLNVVKYLVEKKEFDLSNESYVNNTPLHRAARGGSLPVVEYIYDKGGVQLDAKNSLVSSPLLLAMCYNEDPEVVKFFIDQGADINNQDKNGHAPSNVMNHGFYNKNFSPYVKVRKEAYLKKEDMSHLDSQGNFKLDYSNIKPDENKPPVTDLKPDDNKPPITDLKPDENKPPVTDLKPDDNKPPITDLKPECGNNPSYNNCVTNNDCNIMDAMRNLLIKCFVKNLMEEGSHSKVSSVIDHSIPYVNPINMEQDTTIINHDII
ncbi:ankyrin repeat domain-containing protein [Wolbachia endosymbiont of Chironomus riparius]|uniref:ankyrin repeat domain-containing protein n=1 Tax=Wolbachia endosymbiont of Chironomus riparius TaxID=2883238 RepID=UPI00209EFD5D|nr:ankyrin repeat domain-containing protein [Wolbachia endosymbiont of Chironomus riparius]